MMSWSTYVTLHDRIGPQALAPLSAGLVCFVIAAAISAAKAGLWKYLRGRFVEFRVLRR
jgi:hypothetical protein